MNIVAAVLFFLFRRRMGMTQPELTLWRNLSLLSVLLVAPLWYIESTTVIDRLSLYAVPLQLVVFSRLPYALQKSGVSAPMVSAAVVVYSALVLLTYMSLASHAKYYIPYQIYPWG